MRKARLPWRSEVITIGLRAAPKAVTFAVYDADNEGLLNVEEIKVPAAFAAPDALKYIRSNLLDILREFQVLKAGVREAEQTAQKISIERIHIEGVIQEAFASSNLIGYYIGSIASITSRLGIPRKDFKLLVDGEKEYSVDNWSNLSSVEREAVLCAMGAVNA